MKCLCCHAEKDPDNESLYPYPDGTLTEEPIPDLLMIECQDIEGSKWRMAILCHECWHRLGGDVGIDMWISERCWKSLNPKTPFENLPLVVETGDKWDAKAYAVNKETP